MTRAHPVVVRALIAKQIKSPLREIGVFALNLKDSPIGEDVDSVT
jgi:hypothetical protein